MEIAALKLDTGERLLLVPGGSNPHYAPTGGKAFEKVGTAGEADAGALPCVRRCSWK